jgi:hypothetical protein
MKLGHWLLRLGVFVIQGRKAMPLFKNDPNLSEDDKKLSVVTFWLFVVAVFAWVIPFTVLFVLGLMGQALGGRSAFSFALLPSIATFAVASVLCAIVYFAYKRLVLKV